MDNTNTDNHHVKGVLPAGIGVKVPWIFQIPLCREHHNLFHSMGHKSWQQEFGVNQAEEFMRVLDMALFQGVLKIDL